MINSRQRAVPPCVSFVPAKLSPMELAVLFALYIAAKGKGRCVGPQDISRFLRSEIRVGSLEPWDIIVQTLNDLVSNQYLEKCEPRLRISGYSSYRLTAKGMKAAMPVVH